MNFALFVDCDPLSFEEVAQDDCWLKVMDEKIYAIEKNNTREFINLPNSKKPISIKWLYKNQVQKKNGEVDRFKARLVVKCYKKNPSIDHVEFLHLLLDLTLFIWLSLVLHKIIGKIFKYM